MDNNQVLRLLGRIEQADEGAFRELYCAFSRKLYAYVLRQLSDPAQAEEIVADTLYEVWKAPAKFRGDSQFSTWLIGIARNKVLMHWRSRKPDADHDDVADMAEQLPSDAPGAFDIMADQQRSVGVRNCVDKLSADHRECVHLVFYQGMALADVARIQQIPEGTVKTRLFHARQKLKQCLQRMLAREGEAPLGEIS
jgi:RNA polymerase sigma-70 factor, ECF subfamily